MSILHLCLLLGPASPLFPVSACSFLVLLSIRDFFLTVHLEALSLAEEAGPYGTASVAPPEC